MRVVTGYDLPAGHPGDAMALVEDLYCAAPGAFAAAAYTLTPQRPAPSLHEAIRPLPVAGRRGYDGAAHEAWVEILTRRLEEELRDTEQSVEIVHCQSLTFGMTPALIKALPGHPKLALVHGADLRLARHNATQLAVLRHAAAAVDTIVVPAAAFAARLASLAPDLPARKITHIPWGVPDRLLTAHTSVRGSVRRLGAPLRLLFTGRLGPGSGAAQLVEACRPLTGVELALAGPGADFKALAASSPCERIVYLGEPSRALLWECYRDFDLLVAAADPDTYPRAAIEAQACGLGVLYPDTPVLRELFADCGRPLEISDPAAISELLQQIDADRSILHALRVLSYGHARRMPMRATITALAQLSRQVADARIRRSRAAARPKEPAHA